MAEDRCRKHRLRILEISQQVPALHIAPSFSCVEILDTLYNDVMRRNGRVFHDLFVLSKGHSAVLQYVVLEGLGLLRREELDLFCKPGGRLGTHPELGVPHVTASTGSLGHGLPMAVGMAYAEKLKGSDVRVYCLLSDGECQEGSTWEAIMMAANLGLTNLVAIVDNNNYGGLSKLSEAFPAFYPLLPKFDAFGWEAAEIPGHDSATIRRYLEQAGQNGVPSVLICRTVKGQGVSFMVDNPIWHYRSPTPEEYAAAVVELSA